MNASIPVSGVAGLHVNVKIPAGAAPLPSDPTYVIDSSIDLAVTFTAQTVTLIFDKPVKSVSASIGTEGRFLRSVTMSAYRSADSIGSEVPIDAQVSASDFDFPSPGDFATTPMQVRGELPEIQAVVLQVDGNPSEYVPFHVQNVRIESGSAPDPASVVPRSGLRQWLRADKVYSPSFFTYLNPWPDESGHGADARPSSSSVTFVTPPDGPNCSPVVSFAGDVDLTANLPINGWTGMTVFLVANSQNDVGGWWENQAVSWTESAFWGTTFLTPSQSHVFFRFGTTQPNNQPIYNRPNTFAGDYSVTTMMHGGRTDSLYVNGLKVFSQGGKYESISGVTSMETIGAGLNGSYFKGNIGELLVYDRALSATEREIVEHYLMRKFGVF